MPVTTAQKPVVKESTAGLDQKICAAGSMDVDAVWQATTLRSQVHSAAASQQATLPATAKN